MITRFFLYGIAGWIIEILWTAAASLKRGDKRMIGYTSLWMMPIYGSAVMFEPLYGIIYVLPVFIRGLIYMTCIFAAEFLSGFALEEIIGSCPWDYSSARYNVCGLIRLDYAPCWFAVGLLFEFGYKNLLLSGIL